MRQKTFKCNIFLGYNQDRFEVIDIASQWEGMKYLIGDGLVAIAWADTKPLTVHPDDMVLSLNMKAKEKISEPSTVFSIMPGRYTFSSVVNSPSSAYS